MKTKNNFYVARLGTVMKVFFGYSWATGELVQDPAGFIGSTTEIDVKDYSRFVVDTYYTKGTSITIYYFDESKKTIKTKVLPNGKIDVSTEGAAYLAYSVSLSVNYSGNSTLEYLKLKEVTPHYKNLKKRFTKESGHVFFRESIDSKILLWDLDYVFIYKTSIEDRLVFYAYRNGVLSVANEFNKADCIFDHAKGSVELKFAPKDNYTKVLNEYNKSHDLLKLGVGKSVVELTKRCVFQIYSQGENVITNYAGGTYWEEEVTPIDDANALRDKYYFSENAGFGEINLSGFNYDDLNATYRMVEGERIWNGAGSYTIMGTTYEAMPSIVFTKVASAGSVGEAICLSDGVSRACSFANLGNEIPNDDVPHLYYDTYRIEIYSDHNGNGLKLYQSEALYGNDSNFMLAQGQIYKMVKVAQNSSYKEPEPESFYLGEKIITHTLWGRLLCDVSVDANGESLHSLPLDDFATTRANFRYCIGLRFTQSNNKLISIVQSQTTQDSPTPFGLNDSGKYFVAPHIGAYEYAYPLARSTWGNTSLWVIFKESDVQGLPSLEAWAKAHYKAIKSRDCMEVGAIIKAILAEIDPSIKFESTEEFSQFLYGSVTDSPGANKQKVYITQKSNILKGEYDQAAQKAEITFEQIMGMLRDCFRCYWFIDSEKRFRVEHIRYFMRGLSYDSATLQFDFTKKYDKFNKKPVLYGQQKVSYNRADLSSRYEFAWSDNTTEALGGGFWANIHSNYVQPDKIENINIDLFTPDIDMMMFAPDKFSQDGFALIVADSNNKVPIVYKEIYNQQDTWAPMRLNIQNYYASFISLFSNYLYDMPAPVRESIKTSIDQSQTDSAHTYYVNGAKRSMIHRIEFQADQDIDLYKLIGTNIGSGYIESMSVDIDTQLTEVELRYEPK